MDAIKAYFNKRYFQDDDVSSIIFVQAKNDQSSLIDGFDLLFLIISKHKKPHNYITHYIKDEFRIQERWIHAEGLQSWILNGENRNIIQWMLNGDVVFDKGSYVEGLRQNLIQFPLDMRKKKMFIEFSLFLRKYVQGREYIELGNTLDAYNSVLEALMHWGRISLVESGQHPEIMVWKQLKEYNLGVYKMYEELTTSLESVEQKVRLVLLACEFSVMSKMEECCAIIFDVLRSREEPWSANELKYHPELVDLHVELALVLQKMLKKSLIQEVPVALDNDKVMTELRYTC